MHVACKAFNFLIQGCREIMYLFESGCFVLCWKPDSLKVSEGAVCLTATQSLLEHIHTTHTRSTKTYSHIRTCDTNTHLHMCTHLLLHACAGTDTHTHTHPTFTHWKFNQHSSRAGVSSLRLQEHAFCLVWVTLYWTRMPWQAVIISCC